ncbi:UNVERIFIED_CONTAM: Mrp family chromosome partitioning ATPase [Acetivibrio alkalicellulosi]
MGRITLVIADTDEEYVERIVNYLMSEHSHKFQVNSFTKQEILINYLNDTTKKVDVLLISPSMMSNSIPENKAEVIILLTSGNIASNSKDYECVNKYQHAERFVSNILDIFSEKNSNEIYLASGSKQAKVIAVYSPVGGVGKTTVAVSASIQYALKGFSVFYLNLESIQSTPLFFNCDSVQNLSKVLFYLKENNKNPGIKIEGAKLIDEETNIHYFTPPDSALEMEEITGEELKRLISHLKMSGCYDFIFVDMSSNFDHENISILECCNEVLLVFSQDRLSEIKASLLNKEFKILNAKNSLDITNKAKVVVNKWDGQSDFKIESLNMGEYMCKIPIFPQPFDIKELAGLFSINI